MHTILLLTALFGLLSYDVSPVGQLIYPNLPEADYAVYTAIVDKFSGCNDAQSAFRRGQLLFIESVTAVPSKHGFRFDFATAQEELPFLLFSKDILFYKDPAWKIFIASVDTSQFVKYQITHPLTLKCRKSTMLLPQMQEYYFGKGHYNDYGYPALERNYKNLGGIIGFSKVVYTKDRQKALFYYSKTDSYLSGAGYLIFVERKNNSWEVVGSAMLWIS